MQVRRGKKDELNGKMLVAECVLTHERVKKRSPQEHNRGCSVTQTLTDAERGGATDMVELA